MVKSKGYDVTIAPWQPYWPHASNEVQWTEPWMAPTNEKVVKGPQPVQGEE